MLRRCLAATVALGLLTACGGSAGEAGPTVISPGTVQDGAVVPAPRGEAVLLVRGDGLRVNTDAGVAFDIAAIERLPTVEAVINDPWEKRSIVYRGVLMSEFLAAVGAPTAATTVTATALDDYRVVLDAAELRSGTVLLATQADGEALDVKAGGPTRIVFLPASKSAKDEGLWIWSLKDMTIQ